MRFNQGRQARSRDFVLNKPPIARPRFWCRARISAAARRANTRPGRCWISASVASSRPASADILLWQLLQERHPAIKLPQEQVDKLMDDAERGANAVISIDLEKLEIRGPDGRHDVKFDLDPFRRQVLLNGWDGYRAHPARRRKSIERFSKKTQGDAGALAVSPAHSGKSA